MRRVAGVLVLVAAGLLSLPVVAALLDSAENLIFPVHLLVMAALGAGVCLAVPALAGDDAARGRRVVVGVGWGLLAALVGLAVFWLLISGLDGA